MEKYEVNEKIASQIAKIIGAGNTFDFSKVMPGTSSTRGWKETKNSREDKITKGIGLGLDAVNSKGIGDYYFIRSISVSPDNKISIDGNQVEVNKVNADGSPIRTNPRNEITGLEDIPSATQPLIRELVSSIKEREALLNSLITNIGTGKIVEFEKPLSFANDEITISSIAVTGDGKLNFEGYDDRMGFGGSGSNSDEHYIEGEWLAADWLPDGGTINNVLKQICRETEKISVDKAQTESQQLQQKVTFPAVFKKSQGKGAGLYAITAILDDKRQTRILSKEDVQKYFSLDKEGKHNFAFELADKYLVKDPGKERIAEAKADLEKAMDEHLEQNAAQPLEVTLARHDVSLGNLFRDAEGKYYTDSGIEQDMSKPVHLYRLSPATDPYGEPDVLVDNIKVLNPPSYRETRQQQHSFDYMMLDRLRGDIEAYLNKPGDCRFQNKSQIWGQDTEVLVKEMRKLWDKIPADIKPEWLTEDKLKDYETAVTNEKNVSKKAMDEHLEQDVESQLRDLVDVINSDRALPFNNNKEIVIDSKSFRAFKADEYAPVIADSIELYETLYDAADRENPVTIGSLTNEQAAMVYPLIIETLKARQERNANDNDIVKNIVVDIEYKYRGEKYNNVSLSLCDEDDEEISIDRGQLYEDGVYHSAATLDKDVIDFKISCPEGTEILDIYGESRSMEDAILISNIRVQYQSGKVEVQEVNGDIILRDNSQDEDLSEEEDIDEEEEEEEEEDVSRGFHR